MNSILVATFNELEPADKLKQEFQKINIPAQILDESKLEKFWFLCEPFAAFHVEVDEENYLRARQVMREWDNHTTLLRSAVRCPECKSSRVEYPQLTRKFVTPTLGRIFMALRLIPKEFYCLDCQLTWPTVMELERKRDLLGWSEESKKPKTL